MIHRRALATLGITLALLFSACRRQEKSPPSTATPVGDAKRGAQLIDQYACTACHIIPGVPGPKGILGPSLDHMASRPSLAGKFPNTPETMTRYLQNPQGMDPQNAMPNLNVTPADSRDITAYLFTLK